MFARPGERAPTRSHPWPAPQGSHQTPPALDISYGALTYQPSVAWLPPWSPLLPLDGVLYPLAATRTPTHSPPRLPRRLRSAAPRVSTLPADNMACWYSQI